jgi:hypothetical protein
MQLRETEPVRYKDPPSAEKTKKNQGKVTVSIPQDQFHRLKEKIEHYTGVLNDKIRHNDTNYVKLQETVTKIGGCTKSLLDYIDDGFDEKNKAAERRRNST